MPRQQKQSTFDFPAQFQHRREHGGDVRAHTRKLHRPLEPGLNHHLVLRSERARGNWSFLHRRNRSRIESLIYTQAANQGIRIDRLANVGNHLHLIVLFRDALAFRRFLKAIGGLIVRAVTGARKGRAITMDRDIRRHTSHSTKSKKPATSMKRKFWDGLAYTRLVTWGRELNAVRAYLGKNQIEAIGFRGARLRFRGTSKHQEAVVVVGEIDPEVDPSRLTPELRRLFR